jgi:multidrug efflux pump subunit AcrA (membrane-fusion protein)
MKPKLALLLVLLAAAAGAVWILRLPSPPQKAAAVTPPAGKKVLYYQSPMHPWIKSDQPGKCPICGMDMVPVYESANTGSGIKLSAGSVSAANIQMATVERRPIGRILRVAGIISGNSRTEPWFEFEVYERDLPWLKTGQAVEVVVPGIPGKPLTAEIKLPGGRSDVSENFDAASDGTKVRAEISDGNGSLGDLGPGKLSNGIYAEGSVRTATPEVVAVPRSAVLSPGAQPVVYVDAAGGFYEPRKIKLGRIGDEFAEVLDGVKPGEKVVTSGGLLIDAEAQISQAANN